MTSSPDETDAIDSQRDGPSREQDAMRRFVIGFLFVGVAILTFFVTTRAMAILNEQWQVSSHGSSESIALLVFITIALALIAAVFALPFVAAQIEDASIFAPILLALSVVSGGMLALLIAVRERVDLSVGSLYLVAILLFWGVYLASKTIPKLMARFRRFTSSRGSIDGPG